MSCRSCASASTCARVTPTGIPEAAVSQSAALNYPTTNLLGLAYPHLARHFLQIRPRRRLLGQSTRHLHQCHDQYAGAPASPERYEHPPSRFHLLTPASSVPVVARTSASPLRRPVHRMQKAKRHPSYLPWAAASPLRASQAAPIRVSEREPTANPVCARTDLSSVR